MYGRMSSSVSRMAFTSWQAKSRYSGGKSEISVRWDRAFSTSAVVTA